ncbi:hypothetical protein QR680_006567 [Steinernema hermaphroditum]|uniref:Piwi domain-containing protein n=1 Tax=Steinernema hermaphroditum TaxID=289476 RepID=A0AA39HYC1_9BILA|nr:hypothetical protein QR680_006567 [Steinernema hermaphroditum]
MNLNIAQKPPEPDVSRITVTLHGMDSTAHVEAKILPAPDIAYDQHQAIVQGYRRRVWSIENGRFARPARPPLDWVICVWENAVKCDTARKFIEEYRKCARRYGLDLDEPVFYRLQSSEPEQIKEACRYFAANDVTFVLSIIGEIDTAKTGLLTIEALKYKFIYQIVLSKTVVRIVDPEVEYHCEEEELLQHIVMRTNVRLGGCNHDLASSMMHPRDYIENLLHRRIFIGLHMRQSSSEHLNVAAMTYTQPSPVNVRGCFWFPEASGHIPRLPMLINDALEMYRRSSAKEPWYVFYPEEIVIFRSVSNMNDIETIKEQEIPHIKEMLDMKDKKRYISEMQYYRKGIYEVEPQYNPRLVVIAAMECPHVKLQKYETDENGNTKVDERIRPGTCVDCTAANEAISEFYLDSIGGSSNPEHASKTVRYIVVHDDAKKSADQLQNLTHALCYANGISTAPTALPEPLLSAHELVCKGRSMLKALIGSEARFFHSNHEEKLLATAKCYCAQFWA